MALSLLVSMPGFFDAFAVPFDADLGKCGLDYLAHRPRLAGREHEIIGLVRLQNHVHALDIVACMPPVALGCEVAELERLLKTDLRRRG